MIGAEMLSALWWAHGRRAGRFAVVGAANTAIDVGLFNLLFYAAGWPLLSANTAGYTAGITNSYLLNRRWAFADLADPSPGAARGVLFVACNLVGLGLANLVVYALATAMPAWFAKLIAVGVTFAWNYWSAQRFVFARPRAAGPPGRPPDAPPPPPPPAVTGRRTRGGAVRRRRRSAP